MENSVWTKWKPLDGDHVNKVEHSGGLYQIGIVGEGNSPVKIQRFNGTDKDGIIYIGRSKNLRERLKAWLMPSRHFGSLHWLMSKPILRKGGQKYGIQFRVRVGHPDGDLKEEETAA